MVSIFLKWHEDVWYCELPVKSGYVSDKIDLPEGSEWLNPVTKQHILKHSKFGRKTVPRTLRKKSSVLPAVEPPHPGLFPIYLKSDQWYHWKFLLTVLIP